MEFLVTIRLLNNFLIQPFDKPSRMLLMEVTRDRHGKRSTLIAGQLPVVAWYCVIGDQTMADAIGDRMVNDAHHTHLQGESLRRKRRVE